MQLLSYNQKYKVVLGVVLLAFLMPMVTFAASSSKLTCELTAITKQGEVKLKNKDTVLLQKGEEITIEWESTNAKKAFNTNKKKIDLEGSLASSPTKTTKQVYNFENGSKNTKCEVSIVVVKGSIDEKSLSSVSTKPTIKGSTVGSKSVQIEIYKEGSNRKFFTSRMVSVKNGTWSTRVTKELPKGTYDIVLVGDKNISLNHIATGTLTIGTKATSAKDDSTNTVTSSTTFVVESVPLLVGGIAKGGNTIPISYLQVLNIGKNLGTIESIKVKQNGTASVNSVVGFTVSNEQGVVKILTAPVFKDGYATIPVVIPLQPNQMQLLTVKAIVAPNIAPYVGKQLKLDISSVTTNAKMQSTFPILGATWILGN